MSVQGIEQKVALVTGAASGIGRASALAFARGGARVMVSDVDVAGGEATVARIRDAGGTALFVRADVTKESEVEALVQSCEERFGALHLAHNNAGMLGKPGETLVCTEENWDRVMALNVKGVFLCMKHEIAAMLRAGGGAIVNTSSGSGLVGTPGLPAYAASKHAVVGLTKSTALEVIRRGIRVNAVCPGVTRTAMLEGFMGGSAEVEARVKENNPSGRLGTPEEVADAVIWLCSAQASFVNGACLSVDGGAVAK
jgi:NAD(P)-dependent dehydrogenase (short-subunit alcohol dehydrogenase family)